MPTGDQGPVDTRLHDLATGKIDAAEAMAAQEKKAASVPASAAMREMPRYIAHKKVHALMIKAVNVHTLTFAEPGYAPLVAPAQMFARYTPVPGDFYVVYADGYQSFSPGKAFIEGYTRLK